MKIYNVQFPASQMRGFVASLFQIIVKWVLDKQSEDVTIGANVFLKGFVKQKYGIFVLIIYCHFIFCENI